MQFNVEHVQTQARKAILVYFRAGVWRQHLSNLEYVTQASGICQLKRTLGIELVLTADVRDRKQSVTSIGLAQVGYLGTTL